MKLSAIGNRLTAYVGIVELMDDLGQAMGGDQECLFLGGGNPAMIPEVSAIWRERMQALLDEGDTFDKMLCNYDTPQGYPAFLDALVEFLNDTYDWGLTRENVVVTNGSQTGFFYLFNMLAGEYADGTRKKILLPLMPEYLGYADAGMLEDLFVSIPPVIEEIGDHQFKYHINFDALIVDETVGAIAVSRPTNPSGNVLTDDEMKKLSALAKENDIPLIVDNAYGAPFPEIIFSEVKPEWDDHVVLSLSLSKIGLPGTRTGIFIGNKKIVSAIAAANGLTALACGNVGQRIAAPLIKNGEMQRISRELVRPFYETKSKEAMALAYELFDPALPWRIHVSEGALFLWLWCKDLPISSRVFYERLKDRGVIVVSGHYFFYGLVEDWPHSRECLRLNFSQPTDTVREGLRIIGEEMQRAYRESGVSAPEGSSES
jgi:valine--pyruvate aminotransferase